MQHVASLEILRIAGAVSVVARHLGPELRDSLPGGLTAMAFLSFIFAFPASRENPDGFMRSRLSRIALPWLFWCAVYAMHDVVVGYPERPAFAKEASLRDLLIGTSIHLWYLPFVCVFGVALAASHRVAWVHSPWTWLLLLAPACWAHVHGHGFGGRPMSLWMNALPGLGFAGALAALDPNRTRDRRLIAFATFVALGVFVPMWLAGIGLAYVQLFVIPLAAAAWCIRTPASPRLVDFGKLTYGVYLIHPLAIWACARWLERDSLPALIAVTTLSFGAAAALRVTPLKRFV